MKTDKNIRIARQLIRLAKSLVTGGYYGWAPPDYYVDDSSLFDDYRGMRDKDPDYRKFKSDVESAGWKITDEGDGGKIDTDDDGETLRLKITVERVSGSKTFDQLYDPLENKEYGDEYYDGFVVDEGYPEYDDNYNDIDGKGYIVLVCKKYYPEL